MAQDPVLQREMFNTRGRSAKGSGITSMVDDGSSGMTREERLQIAKAMLAEAQMKQSPEYYFNTLAASDRPAMTRPVASSAPPPAMQQMPAAQQMAQMQAAGVRPVGMADGGEVRKGFQEGGPTFTEKLGEYAKMPSDYFRREILGIEDAPAPSLEDSSVEPTVELPDDGVPRDEDGNVLLFDPEGNRVDYFMDKGIQAIPYMSALKKLGTARKGLPRSATKPKDFQSIIDRSKKPSVDPSNPFDPRNYGPQLPKPQSSVPSAGIKDPALNLSSFERLGLGERAYLAPSEAKLDPKVSPNLSGFGGGSTTPGIAGLAQTADKPIVEAPREAPAEDRKLTALEGIKAEREAQKNQNFNLALMQAGLAMMGGKSSNALQNIAEGGISGLAAYTGLEKSDRAAALDERKMAAYENALLDKEEQRVAQATRAAYIAKQRGEISAQQAYQKWAESEGAAASEEEKLAKLKSLQDRFTNLIYAETVAGARSNPLDLEVE